MKMILIGVKLAEEGEGLIYFNVGFCRLSCVSTSFEIECEFKYIPKISGIHSGYNNH